MIENVERKIRLPLPVKVVRGPGVFIGLIFRWDYHGFLVLDMGEEVKKDIHSFFCFFPVLVLLLDKERRVVERTILRPFSVYFPRERYRYVVESHARYDVWDIGDRVRWDED